jgi:transposase
MVSVPLSRLPMFAALQLEMLEVCEHTIILHAASTTTSASCPSCAAISTSVHSAYTRTLADLPWSGWAVRLRLRVRRFFCRTPSCPRTTFVEQIPALTRPHAQHTTRANDLLCNLGLALGGEAGHRFAQHLALTVSPDTLLRRVRRLPPPVTDSPQIIGVDEWAKRKGRRYGAIVVDLERHQVLDALPDASAEQFAAWLKDHPSVTTIARDRANTFAQGAQQGAPNAAQVADRWHLTRNLGDALEALLQRNTRALREAAEAQPPSVQPQEAQSAATELQRTQAVPPSEVICTATEQQEEASMDTRSVPSWPHGHSYGPREIRQEQFETAKRLYQQGWSYRRIAQDLDLNWRTAKKYVQADLLPQRILPQTTSSVTPYASLIQAAVATGTRTGIDIWRTLQEQGYRGGLSSVYRALKHLQPEDQRRVRRSRTLSGSQQTDQATVVSKPRPLSTRQAKWLLVRQEEKLKTEEIAYRERLCGCCPEVATAYPLAQEFMRLIRERDGAGLDGWLADVQASGVRELKQFAKSLLRDEAAVRGALDTAWSTGQVEGQINRLKLVKRTMYGRGSVELLRQRMLNAA